MSGNYQQDNAFNFALVGYNITSIRKGFEEKTVLRVCEWTSNQNAEHKARRKLPPVRPSMNECDMGKNSNGRDLALWVGVILPTSEHYRSKGKVAIPEGKEIESKPTLKNNLSVQGLGGEKKLPILKAIHETQVARVVARVTFSDTKPGASEAGLKLYELRNPNDEGLSVAFPVSIEDVFYFQEYRKDDLSSVNERRSDWSKKIREAINKTINKKAADGFRAPKNTSVINFCSTLAQAYDAEALSNEYAVTQSTFLLGEIKNCLLKLDKDLSEAPKSCFPLTFKALDPRNKSKFPLEDWKVELETQYPGISEALTMTRLEEFLRGIRISSHVVPYADLRAALVLWCMHRLGTKEQKFENDKRLGEEFEMVLGWVYLSAGCGGPKPQVYHGKSGTALMLTSHIKVIRSIIGAHKERVQALVDSSGTAIVANSQDEIFEKFAASPDYDAAKVMMRQLSRFNMRELAAATDVTTKDLERYLKHLEKLLADVSDEEESKMDVED